MNFTWSFSSLKEYVNCPKQYQEVKVLKRFYKAPTQAMTYGNEVHKALEDYVNSGIPLAKNYLYAKETLDHLISIDGIKLPEHRMALNKDREPCSYGKDYWVRGIADLVIIDGADAFIIDYKTGSNKFADVKQLKLMALMTFAHFPEVMNIKAGLLFINHNDFINGEYSRDKIPELWAVFDDILARMDVSYETDTWQANPTPLCGWCPVYTCEFHRER